MTQKQYAGLRRVDIEVQSSGLGWTVWPIYEGVDRVKGVGMSCGDNRALAERLKNAAQAGVALDEAEVKTDINGDTYASASWRVRGRCLNADLRRLGF